MPTPAEPPPARQRLSRLSLVDRGYSDIDACKQLFEQLGAGGARSRLDRDPQLDAGSGGHNARPLQQLTLDGIAARPLE